MIGRIHIQTERLMRRIYENAVEIGSGAIISSFVKIGSGIQKLIWGVSRRIDRKEMA
jgi:hypothetical protein